MTDPSAGLEDEARGPASGPGEAHPAGEEGQTAPADVINGGPAGGQAGEAAACQRSDSSGGTLGCSPEASQGGVRQGHEANEPRQQGPGSAQDRVLPNGAGSAELVGAGPKEPGPLSQQQQQQQQSPPPTQQPRLVPRGSSAEPAAVGATTAAAAQDAGAAGNQGRGSKPKLPRPEGILPCPRCESTDTKWCYYNNYNIKQPRYFCRACQRYWTAGGALRDVPVGAGKRKSKATKSSEQGGAGGAAAAGAVADTAAAAGVGVAGLAATLPLPAVLSQVPLQLLADPALATFAGKPPGGPGGIPVPAAILPHAVASQLPGVLPQVPPYAGLADGGLAAGTGAGPNNKLADSLGKLAGGALLPGDAPAGPFTLRSYPVDGLGGPSEAGGGPKPGGGPGNGGLGGAGAYAGPAAEDGSSADGRRTRMKSEAGAALPAVMSSAGGPPAQLSGGGPGGFAPSMLGPALSAGLAGVLAAAAGGAGTGGTAFGGGGGYFAAAGGGPGPGRFGGPDAAAAAAALGPAHLGTAGPLSSEFFAAAAAQSPHMQPHAAAAAMHAQSLQQLGAAGMGPSSYGPAPYGMGSMWPYGMHSSLGSFGGGGWPGAHPAVQSMSRYGPGFGGMPQAGPALMGHPGLGLGPLGGALGGGSHGGSSLTAAEVAQALAQVPACTGPSAPPLSWSSMPDVVGGGWGGLPGMGAALNPGAGGFGAPQQLLPGQQQARGGQFGSLGGGYGALSGLAQSALGGMVPTSAAPSSSLLAAAAVAAAAASSPDNVVPA